MTEDGQLLWTPPEEWLRQTNIRAFTGWLQEEKDLQFEDYFALHRWSIEHLEEFWAAIWEYFDVQSATPYSSVLANREMPGAEWFPGAQVNYAEHVFRRYTDNDAALVFAGEDREFQALSWRELSSNVAAVARWLRDSGLEPGDRVAAYLTNSPEAVIAMLATVSLGGVWTACSPDLGTPSVLDRFAQLEPKFLFCADGYRYGGKRFKRHKESGELLAGLPSVKQSVLVPILGGGAESPAIESSVNWSDLIDAADVGEAAIEFTRVPFSHPLWILFSSGTTGLPKAIVHCHGGILLEHMKLESLHMDLKAGDRMFFYTTLGWMMWNFLIGSMLIGAVPVLYDGNPGYPDAETLWRLADQSGAVLFGASPTFVQMQQQAGIVPRENYALSNLHSVMLAGSPVSAECMGWFYENVKHDLWLLPGSGGTDVCSGFVGGVPGPPVYAGEIQAAHLGVDAQAFDENGNALTNEVGELVITQPMPSMPVGFWNDADDVRYKSTYFDTYPGVWRQGDFFKINDRGGCFVLGRSDATLNRFGIRIGTAEIYRCLEMIDEIDDALIVNLDLPGGRFFMPLFVKLSAGEVLNANLEEKICRTLRKNYSPRHVPEKIYEVGDIPYTLTGKKMEVPVRKILMGIPATKAANTNVMLNPQSLDYFVNFAEERADYAL